MIGPPSGVRIYLASGATDMRKGAIGLAMLVQQGLSDGPFSGAIFAFRECNAGLIKVLWHEAAQDAALSAGGAKPRTPRVNRNLGASPAHLQRYEAVIDVDSHDCPCCGGVLHVVDEVRTEQLDIVPTQLRVRVTRRPRYGCRACESAVVVAPAPSRPIDGSLPTEATIVHVIVAKFCDSLPLYRQTKMLARQGLNIGRSTLSNWVGQACWWLSPLYDLL
jgi:transposase